MNVNVFWLILAFSLIAFCYRLCLFSLLHPIVTHEVQVGEGLQHRGHDVIQIKIEILPSCQNHSFSQRATCRAWICGTCCARINTFFPVIVLTSEWWIMLCLFASYVCLIHCYNNRERWLSAHGMRICINNLALLDLFMATHLDSATSGNFPLRKIPKYNNKKRSTFFDLW